jgi:hypothetical protein
VNDVPPVVVRISQIRKPAQGALLSIFETLVVTSLFASYLPLFSAVWGEFMRMDGLLITIESSINK